MTESGLVTVLFILAIILFIAWCASIGAFIRVGRIKGHSMDNAWMLWYLGFLASPLTVGLYVAALPDLHARPINSKLSNAPEEQNLPEI